MVLMPLDIVATNVTGLGAVQLAESLIPALERAPRLAVERIYLPDRGALASYRRVAAGQPAVAMSRRLPNAASRLLETTIGGRRFDRGVPLLVLGDVPLRVRARQTLVVQTPHLLARLSTAGGGDARKYAVMRRLFKLNAGRVSDFIVQSDVMRDALVAEYDLERVHVIQQPPPKWLLDGGPLTRRAAGARLRLFYPAAGYPHKNHVLLAAVDPTAWEALVEQVTITLPASETPAPGVPSLVCADRLDPAAMRLAYADSDALLFLSTAESYGFPLVEAMWLGLPVIAPDRGYARSLCGDQAVYFDPRDAASLVNAVAILGARLASGWHPDWRPQLARLPRDWSEVATAIAALLTG